MPTGQAGPQIDVPDEGERPDSGQKPTLQERIEGSRWGRALISFLILFILAGVIIWNIPESEIKRRGVLLFSPPMFSAGLDQSWSVFSPEPQMDTFEVTAQVEFADGTESTWRPPPLKGLVISPYRIYRWRKYAENVRLDSGAHLWDPLARWIARSEATDGLAVKVSLVRRWRNLHPPGTKPPPVQWLEYEFFSFDLIDDSP